MLPPNRDGTRCGETPALSVLGVAEFLIPHMLPKASWMTLAICTNAAAVAADTHRALSYHGALTPAAEPLHFVSLPCRAAHSLRAASQNSFPTH